MHFSLAFPIHAIPLWFLVLSLFLPRICIVVAWLQHSMPATFIPASVNLIQILVALLIPRILILFWIYQDQGSRSGSCCTPSLWSSRGAEGRDA